MRQLNQALFRVRKLYGAPKALLLLCTSAMCAMPMAAWAQSKSGASELPVASQDLASHNMDAHDVAPNKDAQAKSKTLVRIPALNPQVPYSDTFTEDECDYISLDGICTNKQFGYSQKFELFEHGKRVEYSVNEGIVEEDCDSFLHMATQGKKHRSVFLPQIAKNCDIMPHLHHKTIAKLTSKSGAIVSFVLNERTEQNDSASMAQGNLARIDKIKFKESNNTVTQADSNYQTFAHADSNYQTFAQADSVQAPLVSSQEQEISAVNPHADALSDSLSVKVASAALSQQQGLASTNASLTVAQKEAVNHAIQKSEELSSSMNKVADKIESHELSALFGTDALISIFVDEIELTDEQYRALSVNDQGSLVLSDATVVGHEGLLSRNDDGTLFLHLDNHNGAGALSDLKQPSTALATDLHSQKHSACLQANAQLKQDAIEMRNSSTLDNADANLQKQAQGSISSANKTKTIDRRNTFTVHPGRQADFDVKHFTDIKVLPINEQGTAQIYTPDYDVYDHKQDSKLNLSGEPIEPSVFKPLVPTIHHGQFSSGPSLTNVFDQDRDRKNKLLDQSILDCRDGRPDKQPLRKVYEQSYQLPLAQHTRQAPKKLPQNLLPQVLLSATSSIIKPLTSIAFLFLFSHPNKRQQLNYFH